MIVKPFSYKFCCIVSIFLGICAVFLHKKWEVLRKSTCPFGQVKTKMYLPESRFFKNSLARASMLVLMSKLVFNVYSCSTLQALLHIYKVLPKYGCVFEYTSVYLYTVKPQRCEHLGTGAKAFTLWGVHISEVFSLNKRNKCNRKKVLYYEVFTFLGCSQ